MADRAVFPWLFLPGENVFLIWDEDSGGYRVDPDALPDEQLLVDLARHGLSGTSGWAEPGSSTDEDPVFVVGLLRRPATGPPEAEDGAHPARYALPSFPKPSGNTQATRAGWGGIFYPFANQRDGQPIYETPTGVKGHGAEGPHAV